MKHLFIFNPRSLKGKKRLKLISQIKEKCKDLPYEIRCPALLICGEKDRAGSAIRYNKAWHKDTNIPVAWIPDAGHNSNTDQPEAVNHWIGELLRRL